MQSNCVFSKSVSCTTVRIAMMVAFVVACVHSEEPKVDSPQRTLPKDFVRGARALLLEKFPEGHFESSDDSLTFSYHMAEYRSHSVDKTGRIGIISRASNHPASDGFELNVNWSERPGDDRAGGTFGYGCVTPHNYDRSYQNFFELPETHGYMELGFSFGESADTDILDDMCIELDKYGDQVYSCRSGGWNDTSSKAKERLIEIIKTYRPDAIWQRQDDSFFCEYNTMEFDIHAIDNKGNVTPDSRREKGPREDGLIVRLTRMEPRLQRQPRESYGRSHGPYWNHYYAIYNEYSAPFRLDILYGVNTDKNLLVEVTAALDELFGKPARF